MRGQPEGTKNPIQKPFDMKAYAAKLKKLARRTTAAVSQPQDKGRYRNIPCSCGSGKKTKKCCGKGN